ncbi:putative cupredoxin-like copper-binding protein [Janthinobacterium sp. CG_23.3]|uniref:cupredoxin domain-containing protein n=1 Tax=Janthinobacterium sp. CG_23.3 TaxID=3349634 RepID=UPI0038D4EA5F
MKQLNLISIVLAAVCAAAAPAVLAHEGAAHKEAATISPDEHDFGRQGDPAKVTREIKIDMSDAMRFTPSNLTVRQGETIRFVVSNKGGALHEMVLGSMAQLKAHGAMMREHPGMEHDDPYMAHVKPGGQQQMVWQFTKAGEFNFACLAPGHFEAGMIGKIRVSAK